EILHTRRRYRENTLILETEFETAGGVVRVIDCMTLNDNRTDVLRIVEGVRGTVNMCMELVIRFDYGSIVPWVRRIGETLVATAGPDTLEILTPVRIHGENLKSVAEFTINVGDRVPFGLYYRASHLPPDDPVDPEIALAHTEREWREWSSRCEYRGNWAAAVTRSLITLKALTFAPTGGIVAAPTTSLPEAVGGVRNWDYRFCWLRDATFTMNALLLAGYHEEAVAWREWLLRAAAGRPEDLQVLYSITGVRRLQEIELDWLPGYGGAQPVRIGNLASQQFQLDVYGEVMDTLHLARAAGLDPDESAWRIQIALLNFLELAWKKPDAGIWEIRGPLRHFTHSKVMAWVAFDRAIRDANTYGLTGDIERWRRIRDEIHEDVCKQAFDAERNTFTQSYGSAHLDASLLLILQVGFLPVDDPRLLGTVAAIEQTLVVDGLVLRYATASGVDALPAGEGAFLPCSFWLADALLLTGQRDRAVALFEHLLSLQNDVGLLSEEYDTRQQQMLGNFPQALTHMALINTARLLSLPEAMARSASEHGQRPASAIEPA
ncbi:MAG: glycoside hydrolase family 15 protein, partial [Gemmatimonadaceae bacterium]